MNTNQRTRHARSAILPSILFVLACCVWQPAPAQAQWATNGTNINNTNTGNGGVGTANPPSLLTVGNNTTTFPGMAAGVRVETTSPGT